MPLDLNAIERGYGECAATWKEQVIVLRYRNDLNMRAIVAIQKAVVGVLALDGVTRFPDMEACILELARVLLPCTPEIPEHERGWDVVRDGVPVPTTYDEIIDFQPGLPQAMLMAIFQDVNSPNPSRLSLSSSRVGANSPPIESPIISASSKPLSPVDSTPTSSPTPIGSIRQLEPSSPPNSNEHGVGLAGALG